MSGVSLESVRKDYSGFRAVDGISLDVAEGEFVVLLGPSGCGKTTILRMIAGFIEPSAGRILIGGRDVTSLPPQRRNIGMVFQNYALFPTMSVADNVGFALKQRGASRAAIRARVSELLDLVQLEGRGEDRIDMLSGGQQQRVALARAIAHSPQLLLMDEPLGALDVKLREALQMELLRLQRELGITTILVTHDQQEAMVLADRIALIAEGRLQQVGSPADLYDAPANAFVADFIGQNNLLRGRVVSAQADGLVVDLGADVRLNLPAGGVRVLGETVEIGVRPQHIEVSRGAGTVGGLPGRIEETRFLGNVVHCFVRMPWGQVLTAEGSGRLVAFEAGEDVTVSWDEGRALLFPATP